MHIENLKVGEWVIVISQKPVQPILAQDEDGDTIQLIPFHHAHPFEPTGVPVLIKGICPPFLVGMLATDPNGIATINTARYNITKANNKYVKVFKDAYNLSVYQSQSGKDAPLV